MNHSKLNLYDAARVVLRGIFMAINAYLNKKEVSSNFISHLKELEKEEQMKPKFSRRKKKKKIEHR